MNIFKYMVKFYLGTMLGFGLNILCWMPMLSIEVEELCLESIRSHVGVRSGYKVTSKSSNLSLSTCS